MARRVSTADANNARTTPTLRSVFDSTPYLCRRKVRDFQYLQNARVGVGFRIDGSGDRLKLPTDLVRFFGDTLDVLSKLVFCHPVAAGHERETLRCR